MMMTVRTLRCFCFGLTLACLFTGTRSEAQKSNHATTVPTTHGYLIHNKAVDMSYLKTGPFVKLDDGGILTIEKNKSCISHDNGKTWKEYSIFQDSARFDIRIERVLLKTRSGAIILAFANDVEKANWNWNNDIADSPEATIPTYAIRSLDGGKTWQDLQKLHDEWTGANRDIIETKEGNIIFTSMMFRHNPGHHTVITYTSKNNGLNWIRSNVIDLGGVGHHSGVVESTLEQLKDGRIWMLMRTNWGVFWETISENQGLTWKKFKPTKIAASSAPGLLTRLASGRLFLVWNRPFPEGKDSFPLSGGDGISSEVSHSNHRGELSVMFSDDDGKSWSDPIVVARVTDKSKGKNLAYPRVFERNPGEIWISTTYAAFGGYLSFKILEKDLL